MPIENLGFTHLTATQQADIDTALLQLQTVLSAIAPNLYRRRPPALWQH